MVWFFCPTWSVSADWCISVCNYLFLPHCLFSWYVFHMFCSLTPYYLPVSPIYTISHCMQGIEYTTPAISWGDLLSLGCTRSCFRVLCGFMDVATPCFLRALFKASETPVMYGIVTIVYHASPFSFLFFFLPRSVPANFFLTCLKDHSGYPHHFRAQSMCAISSVWSSSKESSTYLFQILVFKMEVWKIYTKLPWCLHYHLLMS